jgi:hypothetical protein
MRRSRRDHCGNGDSNHRRSAMVLGQLCGAPPRWNGRHCRHAIRQNPLNDPARRSPSVTNILRSGNFHLSPLAVPLMANCQSECGRVLNLTCRPGYHRPNTETSGQPWDIYVSYGPALWPNATFPLAFAHKWLSLRTCVGCATRISNHPTGVLPAQKYATAVRAGPLRRSPSTRPIEV